METLNKTIISNNITVKRSGIHATIDVNFMNQAYSFTYYNNGSDPICWKNGLATYPDYMNQLNDKITQMDLLNKGNNDELDRKTANYKREYDHLFETIVDYGLLIEEVGEHLIYEAYYYNSTHAFFRTNESDDAYHYGFTISLEQMEQETGTPSLSLIA